MRLTAEPEPEVVVIDLRDTLSVGPIIAILDRVVRTLVPASHRARVTAAWTTATRLTKRAPLNVAGLLVAGATAAFVALTAVTGQIDATGLVLAGVLLGLAVLATRSDRSWADLRDSRPVRLLIAALEPPDRPDTPDQYAHDRGRSRGEDDTDTTDPDR